jgi:hypothetical protein
VVRTRGDAQAQQVAIKGDQVADGERVTTDINELAIDGVVRRVDR